MLTRLQVRNFKRLNMDVELGRSVVFIGPNNSGKTTALQALTLWDLGLRQWLAKRGGKAPAEKRPGVAINRRDIDLYSRSQREPTLAKPARSQRQERQRKSGRPDEHPH